MYFINRQDAGKKLAARLPRYKDEKDAIILALPRGGVPIAYEIASLLHVPFTVLVARKLGAPGEEELAIGAIAEFGGLFLNEELISLMGVTARYIEEVREKELKELARRASVCRRHEFPDVKGKTVILVDDGVATGATMLAAIDAMRKKQVQAVVVAVPVIANDTVREIEAAADKLLCIEAPRVFLGVGQFYQEFEQVTDEEVVSLLKQDE